MFWKRKPAESAPKPPRYRLAIESEHYGVFAYEPCEAVMLADLEDMRARGFRVLHFDSTTLLTIGVRVLCEKVVL